MAVPEPLDVLAVGPYGTRVGPDLGLREHRSDPHRYSVRPKSWAHSAVNATVTSSATLKEPNSCEYGLIPNSDCRTVVSLDSHQLPPRSSVRTSTRCVRVLSRMVNVPSIW